MSNQSPSSFVDIAENMPNMTAALQTNFQLANDFLEECVVQERLAGENITQYQPVYLKFSDGKYWKAGRTTDLTKMLHVGIATNTATTGNTVRVLHAGLVTNGSWTWVANQPIALDTTAGTLVQLSSAPTVDLAGNLYQIVGYPLSATTMVVLPQMPLWHAHSGADVSITDTKSWTFNGYLVATTDDILLDGYRFHTDVTVTKINLQLYNAPTGSTVTVQLTKDGVGDSDSNVSLTTGNTYNSDWTTITGGMTFTTSERLGIKVIAVDSNSIAQSPTVDIQYTT